MRNTTKRPLWEDLAIGAAGGLLGTAALTAVGGAIHRVTPRKVQRREARVRGSEAPFEVLVSRVAQTLLGSDVPPGAKRAAAQAVHFSYGAMLGAGYASLRRRHPAIGRFGGVPFGLIAFAISDEVLSSALGLAPPPWQLPIATHARGLAAHVAYGVVAEGAHRFVEATKDRASGHDEAVARAMRVVAEPPCEPASIVDEASEESFPASDAPSWSPTGI